MKSERLIGCWTSDCPTNMPAEILWFQRGGRAGALAAPWYSSYGLRPWLASQPTDWIERSSRSPLVTGHLSYRRPQHQSVYFKALLSNCVNESNQEILFDPSFKIKNLISSHWLLSTKFVSPCWLPEKAASGNVAPVDSYGAGARRRSAKWRRRNQ